MIRRLIIVLIVGLWFLPATGRAETADDAFAALATTSFESIRQGVEALTTSGHPRAQIVITSLQSGKLFMRGDKVLFIKNEDGTFVEALTGTASDVMASALKPVRVNNAVRGAIDAALGALRLFALDASSRLAAAEAVFRSRDPAAIPALTRALAKEADPGVKRRMEQARAAALLFAPDTPEPERLDAVSVLRARGDIEARSTLGNLTGQTPAVAAAAEAAITGIDRNLQLWSVLQSVYYGLSLGSVLLLAAAGLAITFGVMGVINMAHGEMVMIGAYVTFMVQQGIKAYLPAIYPANLLFAIPLAFVVAGLIGIAIEHACYDLLCWPWPWPLETLLATWGLSLVLQQAVRSIFGANNRDVDTPGWMSGATELGGLTLTWNRMYIILFAVVVLAALMAALRFTPSGLAHDGAVTQNRQMAAAMGIRNAMRSMR